jgi:hypothetical protein
MGETKVGLAFILCPVVKIKSNTGMQATANSVRSSLAPAARRA